MIRLIPCSRSDTQSYYSGCTVVYRNDKGELIPCIVHEVPSKSELYVRAGGGAFAVSKQDVFVKYFEPYVDDHGNVIGVETARSYKRAPVYDASQLKYLKDLLGSGLKSTFNGVQGRIGSQYYVHEHRSVNYLVHLGEPIGLYNDGAFFIKDAALAERFRECINEEGLTYNVVQYTTSN